MEILEVLRRYAILWLVIFIGIIALSVFKYGYAFVHLFTYHIMAMLVAMVIIGIVVSVLTGRRRER